MKEIINKKFIIRYKERWFDTEVKSRSMARVFQSELPTSGLVIFKKQKTTILINLESWDRSKLRPTTRNEIKKIDLKTRTYTSKKWTDTDPEYKELLVKKYEKFAKDKKITKINQSRLEAFGENSLVTELVIEESKSYHIYIDDGLRCRLLYSWREISKHGDKIVIAGINKLHTVLDIEKIKEDEKRLYDFGGWGEKKERGIDKFKTQFGGQLMREYNYLYFPVW